MRIISQCSLIWPSHVPMVKHFYHPLHIVVLDKYGFCSKEDLLIVLLIKAIRLSEVQSMTGSKLVHNGIAGPNLGRRLLFCSQIPLYNAIRDEFDTSLSMNFGKANFLNGTIA